MMNINIRELIKNYWQTNKPKNTASTAKERLQIIVSHERTSTQGDVDFLPRLERELVEVIAKYFPIERDAVKVKLDRDGDLSVLEINVNVPNAHPKL
jgi:cell division topological specificity factor